MGGSTTSNTYNFMAMGLNPIVDDEMVKGRVLPTIFPTVSSFESGDEIKEEEDKGNMGTSTDVRDIDRTDTDTAPSWENKLRLNEEFIDMAYMMLGAYDEPVPAVTGATTAKKWRFYKDEVNKKPLPMATILQGMNVAGAKPEAFIECVMNTLNLTFDTDKTPSYKADSISNYPWQNQAEPSIVTPSGTEYKIKAGQTSIYLGNVGDALSALKVDANKIDCYLEANTEMSNNLEASACGGGDFGDKNKDEGGFTNKGKLKMNFNDYTMNLKALVATGSTTGEKVSQESVYRQMYIESLGKTIETVSGQPVRCSVGVLLPKVKLSQPTRSRSGSDKATVEMEFQTVANGLNSPVEIYVVTPTDELHWGTVPS